LLRFLDGIEAGEQLLSHDYSFETRNSVARSYIGAAAATQGSGDDETAGEFAFKAASLTGASETYREASPERQDHPRG
jgi:hypothetical protein